MPPSASRGGLARGRRGVDSWTRIRRGPSHHWPLSLIMPRARASPVAATSASARTIAGFDPPSSSCSRVMWGAAAAAMAAPDPMPPVMAIARMRRSDASCAPIVPSPWTSWKTPSGSPASCAASASTLAAPGARSDGFRISVAPAARALAVFLTASDSGAFHGTIASAGPHATWCTSMRRPSTTLASTSARSAQLGGGAAQLFGTLAATSARDGDRHAGVDRLDRAELVGAGGERVGQPVERVGAQRRRRRPAAVVERPVGRRERLLGGLRRRRPARRDRLAGVGVLEGAVERDGGRAARAGDEVELVSGARRGSHAYGAASRGPW